MFDFLTKTRIIRADLQPLRPIFFVYDLLGVAMAFALRWGWEDLAPIRAHQATATVSLTEVALIGFCGFYGMRIAMFIALFRGLRMPQVAEWLVTIIPATIAFACIFLGGPIERAYAAAEGYRYCHRTWDEGTRSSLYVFALRSTPCSAVKAGTAR